MRKTPHARSSRLKSLVSAATAARPVVEHLEKRVMLSTSPLAAKPAAEVAGLNNAAWTSVGPTTITNGDVPGKNDVASRITGIATDPTNPNLYYVSSANGGVFRTTDGGATWTPLTDLAPTLATGAIAIAPSNPNVIYVGLGDATVAFASFTATDTTDNFYGRGILRSLDGGVTWTLLGTQFDGQTIAKIAVSPTDPGTLLVAINTDGENANNTKPTGIFRSTDGGITWTLQTANISTDDIYDDLIYNPANPLQAFASITSINNGQGGIYQTIDGGLLWTNFTTNNIDFGKISLAISTAASGDLFFSLESNYSGDLGGAYPYPYYPGYAGEFDTTSGALTLFTVPIYSNARGFYDNSIAVSQTDPNVIYLGGSTDGTTDGNGNALNGVLESTDGGQTFTDITVGSSGNNGPAPSAHVLTVTASGQLLDGTDAGVWKLTSGTSATVTWSDLNAGLNDNEITSVALAPTNVGQLVAGGYTNGTLTADGSTTWTVASDDPTGYVAIDPTNSQIEYASSPATSDFFSKSTNGGTSFTASDTGITPGGGQTFPPFVIDPTNHNRLLLGTDGVYESVDAGAAWAEIGIPGGGGFNPNDDPVTAVATRTGGVGGASIYAATYSVADGGEIFVSHDDGATWTEIDLPTTNLDPNNTDPLTLAGQIDKIVVDNVNSDTAYVVEDGFNPGETVVGTDTNAVTTYNGQHVFETNDGGTDWRDISSNLPNAPYHALAVLPTGQNGYQHTLYVGGDDGVFVSFDDGYDWHPLAPGLPDVQVDDLEIDTTNGILAAATYGRGVYEISTAVPNATVGSFVFNDIAGTGTDPSTDPGLAGVTLDLYNAGPDGLEGTADDTLVATTVSGPDGAYAFTNVASGSYFIHVVPQTDFYVSPFVVATSSATIAATSSATATTPAATIATYGNSANYVTGDTGLITVTGGTVSPTINDGVSIGVYEKSVSISSPYIGRPQASAGSLVFTVTLSPANTATVSIPYTTANGTAIAGTDYNATSGTLVFTPGVTSLTVPVTILPTTTIENNLTVLLNVTLPTGVVSLNTSGSGLIINDNFPIATAVSTTITASTTAAQLLPITINLSQPAPFQTTVEYYTKDGTAGETNDFNNATGTLTFAAGQTTTTIDLQILQNNIPAVSKQFTVVLFNPAGITLDPASNGIVTILSTLVPTFSVNSPTVTESLTGPTVMPFTVTLPAGQPITTTVNYTTVNGTAIAGTDYTAVSGTLTFAPGTVSQTVDVPVTRLFTSGQSKTFNLVLSAPSAGTALSASATGFGTIVDVPTAFLVFGGKQKAVYLDNINQKVTVSMKGAGTGMVIFLGNSSNNTDAYEFLTTGTNSATVLTVSVAGGRQTTVNTIGVDASIGTINAKTLNLTGQAAITGSAYAVNLGYLAGAALSIGSGTGGSVALAFRRVTNGTITSAIPIRTLTAGAYIDTLTTPSLITAPSVGTIKVKGNFGGTVQTTTLGSLQVTGTLLGASITATDGIGSISAGSITGSSILAGVTPGMTALPADEVDFINKSASIGSVSVSGTFSDSDIASWNVKSVSIRTVETQAGGTAFGVAGGTIGKVRAKAGGKSIGLNDPKVASTFQNFSVGPV
jgi:hypothetical protein